MIPRALPISRVRRLRFRTASRAMHREHYGRGADRTRTLIHQDVVMTRLEGCFTTVEKTMIAEGAFLQVRETRTMFQDWMRPRFTEIVEDATGQQGRGVLLAGLARPRHGARGLSARAGWFEHAMAKSTLLVGAA